MLALPSYPQNWWISFPQLMKTVDKLQKLSTGVVDKLSTIALRRHPDRKVIHHPGVIYPQTIHRPSAPLRKIPQGVSRPPRLVYAIDVLKEIPQFPRLSTYPQPLLLLSSIYL